MDTYDLETAFYKKLAALSFTGRTIKPDEVYDPKDGDAFRRGSVLLGAPETVGFGNGVFSRAYGFYQIDIYIPRGLDTPPGGNGPYKTLMKTADAHVLHFFPANGRGLTLTENDTSAHIVRLPNQRPFEREGAFLRKMIEVDFYVEIPAAG